MTSRPRIAFVGTGANGAGIAADLVKAGLDVSFIEQWPAHVEAMRAHGVCVNLPGGSEVTKVEAFHLCDVATLRGHFDIVFIVVKAYDTRWACELIKPLVAPDGAVVGLQNGMTLNDITDIVGADRAVGAVIEVAANMWEPGIVNRENGPDTAWFAVGGRTAVAQEKAQRVAEVLSHAGTVEVSDDIIASKWGKLIVNAAELVPSALLGMKLAEAVDVPRMHEFMKECGSEAVHTAIESGVKLRPIFGMDDADTSDPDVYAEQLFKRVLDRYSLPSTQTTSLQDWLKGRRNEVYEINGHVVRTREHLGKDAPANRRVVELAERVERGELELSPDNVDLLVAEHV
ncbi:2-dehydropantoate 2-reductase [Cnuibacter physcomitrellae]|uniref:ketopantoate reductase family protein n=1 Tax=Cnuibacter physcomitrellae TaxID=1619308 RepID=UPI002175DDDC|nr:2-dehydropantoate 2-reductase [Cnuibacter physcomitrellae]MCS5497696.1 2-dehydropantoate 2-reductase [Cnuibacter physcomitrellae]